MIHPSKTCNQNWAYELLLNKARVCFELCTVTPSVINGRDHIAAVVSPPSHHDGWCWRHTNSWRKVKTYEVPSIVLLCYADRDRQR